MVFNQSFRSAVYLMALILLLTGTAMAVEYFDKLEPEANRHGFIVENVYLDAKNEPVGARFLHKNTGFTLDLFQIQSVPQSFFWVNSDVTDDRGEPHTCEHLLLGKGNKGRYVASLEDMTLGRSTAYTSQIYTSYTFSSPGGNSIFYDLTAAKLDAFLNPDFSDEEIRREVCNIGVTVDPSNGSLGLDEKGTIYTEMVSYFEKYWYYVSRELEGMMYGKSHPLGVTSGGEPSAIRTMVPQNLRDFHDRCYQLNNMGVITTLPAEMPPDEFLGKMDRILRSVDGAADHPDIARNELELPPPTPTAPPGTVSIVNYPGSNEEEPGQIFFAWPPNLTLDTRELLLLKTFMDCLAGSQTSNLYDKLINSETRTRDLGATGIWASVETTPGYAVFVGLSNVDVSNITLQDLKSVARMIAEEAAAVAGYAPDSPELKDFNDRALGYLANKEKELKDYLNSPPGFGNRGGSGGRWYSQMKILEMTNGFRKSMIQKDELAYARSLLESGDNFWTGLVAEWHLADVTPYGVGAKADPAMLTQALEDKQQRLTAVLADFKKTYGVATDDEAISLYKEDYDRKTAEIEAVAADAKMPTFLENPPLSYDSQLDYHVDTVAGSIPLVSSYFGTMTSATIGLVLNLNVIPYDKLLYIPILPEIITDIGVVKNGEVVDYATMNSRLKNEVLKFETSFSANSYTGRVELVVRGAGGDYDETVRALGWMEAGLFHPWLAPENLSRLRDVVDNRLSGLRNRMKQSEESWVSYPADAYLSQTNPLLLAGDCFLTKLHFIHRLKWRLKGVSGETTVRECEDIFDILASAARGRSKAELVAFASDFGEGDPARFENGPFGAVATAYLQASAESRDILLEALQSLGYFIPDVPDQNVANDWVYLVGQMKNDLFFRPEKALEDITETLALIRHQNNVRLFSISNRIDRDRFLPEIDRLVNLLDRDRQMIVQTYPDRPIILDRMHSRYPDIETPTYVGLVNADTRNGVFLYSHPCASLTDTDENKLLDYLAAKLYSGGGGHSMFMKTWSAGLAYSNGLRSSEGSGRVFYYAERCPDLSVTMKFVVDELKKASYDPALADYAVAQTFAVNRGPNSYESRGEAMAANLADGITPEAVAAFRQRILSLRTRADLYDQSHRRMTDVYGEVLIGYGQPLSASGGGSYFIIGPEAQFEKLEAYVAVEESPQTVCRIYPRDFWLTE